MKTFTLPDLGEGLQDAEIVSWHVSEGDRVIADQPLLSVETEKAVVDVPAPWSGVVSRIHAPPGTVVPIGGALVDFDTETARTDAGSVVGTLSGASAATVQPEPEDTPSEPRASWPPRQPAMGVRATPAVRRLADDSGLDLATVTGTGPDGAITSEDVKAAANRETSAAAPPEEGWEPLRGVRRVMARNMARAHSEAAATTVTELADVTHWPSGEDVTARLVRAIAAACQAEPTLNAWFDGRTESRRLHDTIDLGIAMHTDAGLFVPVLRDIANRSGDDLRQGLEAMKRDIENRSVPPEELRGQTITLSNFGMVGGRHAALMIMPPQVAILGAGRMSCTPRIVGDRIEPGRTLPLSLTFDHRAVAGIEAARFLMTVVKDLEN